VSVEEHEDDVVVRVADRGIGIAEDELTRVFQKHYRGKVKASGTGLGLSIAKTIVEAHGGRIGVVSGADIGTSFHFSLPKSVHAATEQACRW
jgi:signal transduction histidine kinase